MHKSSISTSPNTGYAAGSMLEPRRARLSRESQGSLHSMHGSLGSVAHKAGALGASVEPDGAQIECGRGCMWLGTYPIPWASISWQWRLRIPARSTLPTRSTHCMHNHRDSFPRLVVPPKTCTFPSPCPSSHPFAGASSSHPPRHRQTRSCPHPHPAHAPYSHSRGFLHISVSNPPATGRPSL